MQARIQDFTQGKIRLKGKIIQNGKIGIFSRSFLSNENGVKLIFLDFILMFLSKRGHSWASFLII